MKKDEGIKEQASKVPVCQKYFDQFATDVLLSIFAIFPSGVKYNNRF